MEVDRGTRITNTSARREARWWQSRGDLKENWRWILQKEGGRHRSVLLGEVFFYLSTLEIDALPMQVWKVVNPTDFVSSELPEVRHFIHKIWGRVQRPGIQPWSGGSEEGASGDRRHFRRKWVVPHFRNSAHEYPALTWNGIFGCCVKVCGKQSGYPFSLDLGLKLGLAERLADDHRSPK